jgi:hypothetical protein
MASPASAAAAAATTRSSISLDVPVLPSAAAPAVFCGAGTGAAQPIAGSAAAAPAAAAVPGIDSAWVYLHQPEVQQGDEAAAAAAVGEAQLELDDVAEQGDLQHYQWQQQQQQQVRTRDCYNQQLLGPPQQLHAVGQWNMTDTISSMVQAHASSIPP